MLGVAILGSRALPALPLSTDATPGRESVGCCLVLFLARSPCLQEGLHRVYVGRLERGESGVKVEAFAGLGRVGSELAGGVFRPFAATASWPPS